METNRFTLPLNQLYLDPNNYRLLDSGSYQYIPLSDAMRPEIQEQTLRRLWGKAESGIQDLIDSFMQNGFLNLEPIQVMKLQEDKYLVTEGNRRTATLKYLQKKTREGDSTGLVDSHTFEAIEVMLIENVDSSEHLVMMGLHHIGGKKRWNSLNQARLIDDLHKKYHKTEEEIQRSLGISRQAVNKCLRTLALVESYKKSDYGDQFRSDKYSYFEEVIGSPEMREWLDWDQASMRCRKSVREERLFSWLSYQEDISAGERKEAVIAKSDDIRVLKKFINDENAVRVMEQTGSVAEGFSFSSLAGKNRVGHALETMKRELALLKAEAVFTKAYQTDINKLAEELHGLTLSRLSKKMKPDVLMPSIDGNLFSEVIVNRYKTLSDLRLSNLRQFNLFVGENNSGKTTCLEALYCQTLMNDLPRYVELIQFRNRAGNQVSLSWILDQLGPISISTSVNGVSCATTIEVEQTVEKVTKRGYIGTLKGCSQSDGNQFDSVIHAYEGGKYDERYQRLVHICPSAITSPYRYNADWLFEAHNYVLNEDMYDELMWFIRNEVDCTIKEIQASVTTQGRRFIVTSTQLSKGIDLAQYGEGLQRIFEISLFIMSCRGGCVMIDEVESGIHKRLVAPFIQFIDKLSVLCNVQVFATTHSREAVELIVENVPPRRLSVARLERNESGSITAVQSTGEEVKFMFDNGEIDIR